MRRANQGRRASHPISCLQLAARTASQLVLLLLLYEPLVEGQLLSSRPQLPPIRSLPLQSTIDYGPARPPAFITVPGNSQLLRNQNVVYQVNYPYDSFAAPGATQDSSYIIDHKRFVEAYSSRCLASTLLEDPDSVEPNFVIITPSSERRVNATMPVEAILDAGFRPNQRTTIFVHGFTQSYPETEWLRKARSLFEMHSLVGKQNLIFMDWGVGSHGSYAQVAARASGMGSFLANFLMKLFDLGADRGLVHVIGHSLGAHVSGFAGKRIRPRIGRITGLDAAGPCFGKFFSNKPENRLAADDAYQVDVYHYDDSFLGLPGQIGQFDVYVNGGSSQPGCTDNVNSIAQALVTMVFRRNRPLSESHTRSTEVATTNLALAYECQMIAHECRDWSAFLSGECGFCDQYNRQCFKMDFNYQYANRPEMEPLRQSSGMRFYIATSQREYFCLHHFQIVVKFANPDGELNDKTKVYLELINEQNGHANVTVSNHLQAGVLTHLLLSEMTPSRFRFANVQVRQADGKPVSLSVSLNPMGKYKDKALSSASLEVIEVTYMSNFDPAIRQRLSSRLCPVDSSQAENSIYDSSADPSWAQLGEC